MLPGVMETFSKLLVFWFGLFMSRLDDQLNCVQASQPNLIFILADDLGWNDIGYHNGEILTPNLDYLSWNGIRLNQSYMQPLCTPSRSAIMTGYYPFRTGLQHGVIWRLAPIGLPLQFQTLPEKLQQLGYQTHLVGKWHLGHCHWRHTPTFRGFNTFMGSYAGEATYYTHKLSGRPTALDYHNGTEPLTEYEGVHSSIPLRKQMEHILFSRDLTKPQFLFVAFNLPHGPLETRKRYLDLYGETTIPDRRLYSSLVSNLDDDVGAIVDMLQKHDLYSDSIIIFSSDNGGQVYYGGSNFPYRGNKNTLFEGGTKAVGFIHSPKLPTTLFTYNGLIHAVDWFATLLELAGGQAAPDADGVNVWDSIINNKPSPRKDFVYNIDNYNGTVNAAIRLGDWKLILGQAGLPDDRFTPENVTYEYARYKSSDEVIVDPTAPTLRLFNLKADPYEYFNLATERQEVVARMLSHLEHYVLEAVRPLWKPNDPKGIESLSSGILEPGWCEPTLEVSRN